MSSIAGHSEKRVGALSEALCERMQRRFIEQPKKAISTRIMEAAGSIFEFGAYDADSAMDQFILVPLVFIAGLVLAILEAIMEIARTRRSRQRRNRPGRRCATRWHEQNL